jgi:hypothetical protein
MKQKTAMDKLSGSTKKSKRKRGGIAAQSSAGWTIAPKGMGFFSSKGRRSGSAIMDLLGALFDRFAPVVPLKKDGNK